MQRNGFLQLVDRDKLRVEVWHEACTYQVLRSKAMRAKTNLKAGTEANSEKIR